MLARFLGSPVLMPEGAQLVGRWHRMDGTGGWMVLRAESMLPVTEFTYQWGELLFGEIIPVAEDADLGMIIEKLQTKQH